MEGIKTVDAQMAAFLHPSRAADVLQGVHEILNSLLLRFSEEFDGVILAYLAPQILGRTAKILGGLSPYFDVKLTTRLLLFSPAPGMKIVGKVNKIEKDYIGVLVLGLFNTTIGVVDIREDLYYAAFRDGRRAWLSDTDDQHSIGLGSLIRFSVKSLQETERIIDICGSLLEDSTGCMDWLKYASSKSKTKSKEAKLRSPDSEKRQHKKSLRENGQHRVQDFEKHPQPLGQKDMEQRVTRELSVPTKYKKRKEMDEGKSHVESSHKFKRKKVEALELD